MARVTERQVVLAMWAVNRARKVKEQPMSKDSTGKSIWNVGTYVMINGISQVTCPTGKFTPIITGTKPKMLNELVGMLRFMGQEKQLEAVIAEHGSR